MNKLKKYIKKHSKKIELSGIISIWFMGFLTSYEGSITKPLIVIGIFSIIGLIIYSAAATIERRGRNEHYFATAFLSVALTLITFIGAALKSQGGMEFTTYIITALISSALILAPVIIKSDDNSDEKPLK